MTKWSVNYPRKTKWSTRLEEWDVHCLPYGPLSLHCQSKSLKYASSEAGRQAKLRIRNEVVP